jgi:hypothetical protein
MTGTQVRQVPVALDSCQCLLEPESDGPVPSMSNPREKPATGSTCPLSLTAHRSGRSWLRNSVEGYNGYAKNPLA